VIDLTATERAYLDTLEAARKRVSDAQKDRNAILRKCPHRMRKEEPLAYGRNNAPLWPDHPTCLICGDTFELELYCPESEDHLCHYREEGVEELVSGDRIVELMQAEAHHEDPDSVVYSKCAHCGETWDRTR